MGKQVLLLSDTHSCWDEFITSHCKNADEVWHAGDIGNTHWLDTFSQEFPGKPLRGVHGNIDDTKVRSIMPEQTTFVSEGLRISILHIGGNIHRISENAKDLLKRESPDVFICGHSHILQIKWLVTPYKFLFINPGAAGIHGFHKKRTLLAFEIANGKMENLRVIEKNR